MKKLIILALCLVLILPVLSSCGKSGSESSENYSSDEWDNEGEWEDEDEWGEENEDDVDDETDASKSSNSKSTNSKNANSKSTNSKSSNSKNTNSKSSNATESSAADKNPLDYDLKGRTVRIVSAVGQSIFSNVAGSTGASRAVAERTKKIQTELNCKIVVEELPGDQIIQQMLAKSMNKEKFADCIALTIYDTCGYVYNKVCVPFDGVSTLPLKTYLNSYDMYNGTAINGRHYVFATEDMYIGSNHGVFFNKRIFKEIFGANSENDPYKLVENNKWTISKLREMMIEALKSGDKGGTGQTTQWPALIMDKACAGNEAYFFASGGAMLKASDGNITYNMDAPETLALLEKQKQFMMGDKTSTSGSDSEMTNKFSTGNGLFLIGYLSAVNKFSDMKDEFGYVPFPRGDDQKNYKGIVNWNYPAFMMPYGLTKTEKQDIGAVLAAYAYLSGETSEKIIGEYKDRYFRDDKSGEMLSLVNKSNVFPVSSILASANNAPIANGTYTLFYQGVMGSKPFSTVLGEYKSGALAYLKDFLSKS